MIPGGATPAPHRVQSVAAFVSLQAQTDIDLFLEADEAVKLVQIEFAGN